MQNPSLLGRVSLFIIYFWFGFLKIIGISPAETLVQNLFTQTFGSILDFKIFCLGFGLFECAIGLIWLFPKLTKPAFYLLIFHMVTTFLPVLILPEATWQSWFTPTLVGQYIIKNFALISLGWFIFKYNSPFLRKSTQSPGQSALEKVWVK